MKTDLKSVLARTSSTLWQDAMGAVSLIVMLMVGLNLPALV